MRSLCLLAAGLAVFSAGAETIASGKYKVLSVAEGDLVTVDYNGKPVEVRLYGAEAPEQGQKQFDESKKFVSDQLLDKEVTVESVTQEEGGRPVVVVRIPDGGVLHEELVTLGLAWWDSVNVPENATLKRLNAKAIGGGLGIYQDPLALAPWDFRKSSNLPAMLYLKDTAATEGATVPAKQEPKMLSAKGNAKGDDEYLKAGAAAQPEEQRMQITVGTPQLPDGLGANAEVMDLVARHAPRIMRDGNGKGIGLTADNISQIPFATQLGFQDGDVATAINGMPIDSEIAAMGMVNQLKGQKNLTVNVLRNGQNVTLNVPIP